MDTDSAYQALLSALRSRMASCGHCQAAGLPAYGQPLCSGPARAPVMVVGQAPSRSDTATQQLWSGPAGQQLMAWLGWAGLAEERLRAHHYLTAVVKCYPGRAAAGHGDQEPSRRQVELCRRYLEAELQLVAPRLLIPVGRMAIDFFGGQRLRLEDLVGTAVSVGETWIVPLPHPSGVSLWLNGSENRRRLARALAILRELCGGLSLA